MRSGELKRDSYPAAFFPQARRGAKPFDRAADQRLRKRLLEDLEELPAGVVRAAIAAVDVGPLGSGASR